MKNTFLTFVGLIMGFVYSLNAQQVIQFYDESTWQPLAGVKVQFGNDELLSDQSGKISIKEVFSSTMVSEFCGSDSSISMINSLGTASIFIFIISYE